MDGQRQTDKNRDRWRQIETDGDWMETDGDGQRRTEMDGDG